MLKAYKYRLYPTDSQSILLNKHIGASRFIYNLALEVKKLAWSNQVSLSSFDLMSQLPELKKECNWLKELNAQSLQQSIKNLDTAFNNFFKNRGKYPKFKKKSNTGKFNIPQCITIKANKLSIPKFREGINIILHRPIKGVIKQATISKTPTGKYFVSILCETGESLPVKSKIEENTTIGIDLGIKDFAITSNGKTFENPKFLRKSESKLKFVQRKYSKHKGKRTRKTLALLNEKVNNKRKDFLHKVSTKLIRENQSIAVETLKVVNMIKNHKLAKSISDVSWSTFVTMLEYKANWYGVNILKIGTFEPSSKTCYECGNINKNLTLKDRIWTCSNCNSILDRDLNAAKNIKSFALNKLSGEHRLKNHRELPAISGSIDL